MPEIEKPYEQLQWPDKGALDAKIKELDPITVSFYRSLVVTYIAMKKHLKLRHPYGSVRRFVRGVMFTEHDTVIDNTIYHLVTTIYERLS